MTENSKLNIYDSSNRERGITIGIILLVPLIAFLFIFFFGSPFILFLPLIAFFIYYYAGKYCGKRWSEPSWKWGIWLAIPLIGLAILLFILFFITSTPHAEGLIIARLIIFVTIIAFFVAFLAGSMGAYLGSKQRDRKK